MITDTKTTQVQRASKSFAKFMIRFHLVQNPGWFDRGFSMAQFKVLLLVVSTGGIPGRELARRLGIGPSAVTPLVDKLVRRGLVWRDEDPSDRRVSWARPTAEGIDILEQVGSTRREGLEVIMATLTPGELDLVEQAMKVLAAAARKVEMEDNAITDSRRRTLRKGVTL